VLLEQNLDPDIARYRQCEGVPVGLVATGTERRAQFLVLPDPPRVGPTAIRIVFIDRAIAHREIGGRTGVARRFTGLRRAAVARVWRVGGAAKQAYGENGDTTRRK